VVPVVSSVAPIQSSEKARLRPAARMTFIWLWVGEKSTMQESWPAWGGRTSVGTTFERVPCEKSRSLAYGASSTISCAECHSGSSRRVAALQ
jgi:hypothetical protein